MLVLSRQKDESIRIGDDITVMVVDIRNGKVSLGIDAPRAVPVHRSEVYDEIHNPPRVFKHSGGEQAQAGGAR